MKYYYADVQDKGTFYQIQSIVPNTADKIIGGSTYLPLSLVAHKQILEAMQKDQLVSIKKDLYANEVMPCDLIITDQDPLEAWKNANLIKVKSYVTPEIVKESGFTMYSYMQLSSKLMDKGFYITDDNRDEKYIEIIETENEVLIELLEEFITAKDRISSAFYLKDKYDKLVKEVQRSKTEEQITELCDKFIEKHF